MRSRVDIRISVLLLACIAGCAQGPASAKTPPGSGEPPAGGAKIPEAWEAKFERADGQRAFSLRSLADAVRVEDGEGNLLAVLQLKADGVRVENALGREMGLVVAIPEERPAFRIVGPGGGKTLFKLRTEDDGDLQVKNRDGIVLYDVKKRDYGYKVLGRNGDVESRIRSRPGKISVRDATGTTFLFTRDPMPVEAVVVLTLQEVPIELAAGLAVAIMRGTPPR